jgi:hypothetical protein
MIRDLYYRPRGAPLYNVLFKDGSFTNRVTELLSAAYAQWILIGFGM